MFCVTKCNSIKQKSIISYLYLVLESTYNALKLDKTSRNNSAVRMQNKITGY